MPARSGQMLFLAGEERDTAVHTWLKMAHAFISQAYACSSAKGYTLLQNLLLWAAPEPLKQGTELGKGLEHRCDKERLRELGGAEPGEKEARGHLLALSNSL